MVQEKSINGVNVDLFFSTLEQIKQKPEIARFKFWATNKWIDGIHNRVTIKDLEN